MSLSQGFKYRAFPATEHEFTGLIMKAGVIPANRQSVPFEPSAPEGNAAPEKSVLVDEEIHSYVFTGDKRNPDLHFPQEAYVIVEAFCDEKQTRAIFAIPSSQEETLRLNETQPGQCVIATFNLNAEGLKVGGRLGHICFGRGGSEVLSIARVTSAQIEPISNPAVKRSVFRYRLLQAPAA